MPETDGRELYAKWNPAVWEMLLRGPASRLAQALGKREDGESLVSEYLTLAREAVGLQYIDRPSFDPDPPAPPSFLATCWIEVLPRLLPTAPPEDVPHLLAKVWNVGERLAHEPIWLTRYLTGYLERLQDLRQFETWIRESLTPVLHEPVPARWSGPMTCAVVDCRPFHEDFLPGALHLAAPSVACVHDRRQDRVRLGLLLRPNRASICLGRTPCLGEYRAPESPAITWSNNTLAVGALSCELPHLGTPADHVTSPAGFVVAVSQTSQRLWIAESP